MKVMVRSENRENFTNDYIVLGPTGAARGCRRSIPFTTTVALYMLSLSRVHENVSKRGMEKKGFRYERMAQIPRVRLSVLIARVGCYRCWNERVDAAP